MPDDRPVEQFRRGELVFELSDCGSIDAPVVVLLHGHPQTAVAWDRVIPHVVRGGYRCVAPTQRGLSSGARPTRRRDYRMAELVADVSALIDAADAQRVHLVGHDFGGLVAWSFAAEHSDRVSTLTSLSSPHPQALQRAMLTSRQGLLSWYALAYQLPRLPERFYLGGDGRGDRLARMLRSGGQQQDLAARDARAMTEPGRYAAALNWYRAAPWAGRTGVVSVPTMLLWSDADKYILESAARRSEKYVMNDFRFEVLNGSHWMPDEQPGQVADLLLDWFSKYP